MHNQLNTALERYQAAIKSLEPVDSSIKVEQVLEVLNARDVLQIALKEQPNLATHQLQTVIELDTALRESAERITKTVNCTTINQFALWRETVQPSADAWWWKLESLVPPHEQDKLDWLWKSLTIAGWTSNLSLLVNIASRFLSGGGGVGLAAASAVILPSILTLLQASSELTKAGQEGFDKLLTKLCIPPHFRQEATAASTLFMSVILLSFWSALPSISKLYNRNGLNNYLEGKLGAAEQDYRTAISLNEDNMDAHYNLGNLYEDLQEWDKARRHYQIAVRGDFPDAYNNLARLYIQDKKYSQSAALLTRGLLLADEQESPLGVRYSLFKNLGWTRFLQGRNEEAQQTLLAAISIAENPQAPESIRNHTSAHCILAQVLDKQKQPGAIAQWQECCQGSQLNIEEDAWLHLAHQRLKKAGKTCPTPGS